jgi:hypothetical protein
VSTPEPPADNTGWQFTTISDGGPVNNVVWIIFAITGSIWFIVDLFRALT